MNDRITQSKLPTKLILCLVVLFAVTLNVKIASAVPAFPKSIVVTMPDGTELTVKKHGDEFFNWTTTLSGHAVMPKNGYYYYVKYGNDGVVQFTNQRVSQDRNYGNEREFLRTFKPQDMSAVASLSSDTGRRLMSQTGRAASFPNEGTVRSIIILVEYQDVKFKVSDPRTAFYNLLNKPGYSYNRATGSARDYFLKVSGGKFLGQFDVVGPFTLPKTMAYYGGNGENGRDLRPKEMAESAAILASGEVDFSQYDYDGDGVVDNIFIYYAGQNEAESSVVDAIWPHKSSVKNSLVFNGVSLGGYACSSELSGYSGLFMAGIGTFCHEFCHVFGLNDHYDTNGAQGGLSHGLGYYDVMTSGSYNNFGNTPPMFNAFELATVGWITPRQFAANSGDITLRTIDHMEAYKIPTYTDGEYFLVENRQKNDPDNIWDKYIPASGLVITHVDRSSGTTTLWEYNRPNTNASHECFKFVVAGDASLASNSNWTKVPYPYGKNNSFSAISHPRAISWAGSYVPYNIDDISIVGLDAKFSVSSLVEQQIAKGVIYSSDGELVEGATVIFTSLTSLAGSVGGQEGKGVVITAVSNYRGEYYAEVMAGDYMMTVSKLGYNTSEKSIVVEAGVYELDVTLVKDMFEGSSIPAISLSDYEYKPDIPIELKLLNVSSGDVVKWSVDGVPVTDLVAAFGVGEHTIKAEVTRSRHTKFVVVKKILVR